jgi:hypothetical protein
MGFHRSARGALALKQAPEEIAKDWRIPNRRFNRDAGEVSRTLPLIFLAPDIVAAILGGPQPAGLTPRQLKREVLPFRWDDQRRQFGFHY